MSQVKTAISIRDILFEETEKIARELEIPRSHVITMALEDFIRRYRNKKLLEQINAAFDSSLAADEQESMEIMRSHQRGFNQSEPW